MSQALRGEGPQYDIWWQVKLWLENQDYSLVFLFFFSLYLILSTFAYNLRTLFTPAIRAICPVTCKKIRVDIQCNHVWILWSRPNQFVCCKRCSLVYSDGNPGSCHCVKLHDGGSCWMTPQQVTYGISSNSPLCFPPMGVRKLFSILSFVYDV